MHRDNGKTRRPFAYLNMILTVIAALLALLVIRDPSPALSQAHAASPGATPKGIQNPADQRFQMIAELRKINEKLDRLSGNFKGPVDVNVVKMPNGNGGNGGTATDGD